MVGEHLNSQTRALVIYVNSQGHKTFTAVSLGGATPEGLASRQGVIRLPTLHDPRCQATQMYSMYNAFWESGFGESGWAVGDMWGVDLLAEAIFQTRPLFVAFSSLQYQGFPGNDSGHGWQERFCA